jgi:hypothetical protein
MTNPFDDEAARPRRVNPFGDEEPDSMAPTQAADALEHSAARIRRLKQQIGADGLSLSATRELIDHLSTALDAAAAALRRMD